MLRLFRGAVYCPPTDSETFQMPQAILDHVLLRTRLISQRLGEAAIIPSISLWQELIPFRTKYPTVGVH
eukprot:8486643-Lingulodinium_polyedra.AAC.1